MVKVVVKMMVPVDVWTEIHHLLQLHVAVACSEVVSHDHKTPLQTRPGLWKMRIGP